jgi:hypothetical protein
MTPGIEPATFPLGAQCLNQLRCCLALHFCSDIDVWYSVAVAIATGSVLGYPHTVLVPSMQTGSPGTLSLQPDIHLAPRSRRPQLCPYACMARCFVRAMFQAQYRAVTGRALQIDFRRRATTLSVLLVIVTCGRETIYQVLENNLSNYLVLVTYWYQALLRDTMGLSWYLLCSLLQKTSQNLADSFQKARATHVRGAHCTALHCTALTSRDGSVGRVSDVRAGRPQFGSRHRQGLWAPGSVYRGALSPGTKHSTNNNNNNVTCLVEFCR